MCGIYCIISKKPTHPKTLITYFIKGILELQNRGYDSIGYSISLIDEKKNKTYTTHKLLNKLEMQQMIGIENKYTECTKLSDMLVGHTRWATHGKNSIPNTHPHMCYMNRFAIVHNGIFENCEKYRKDLLEKDVSFLSETDTEVIVNYISYNVHNGHSITDSLKKLQHIVKKNTSFIIVDTHSSETYVFVMTNPIILSAFDDNIIIVSEKYGLPENSSYVCLADGIHKITSEKINEIMENNKIYEKKDPMLSYTKMINNKKTFFEEEIEQQLNILKTDDPDKDKKIKHTRNLMEKYDNVIVVGCGSSYISGLYGSIIMMKKTYKRVICVNGCDFQEYHIPKKGRSMAILISQSGETMDIINIIDMLKENDVKIISYCNSHSSTLSKKSDIDINMCLGREISVASTKSFTSTMKFMDTMMGNHIDYSNIHIQIGNSLKNIDCVYYNKFNSITILGDELNYPSCLEGVMKIKEVCYINSFAYTIKELKHGPLALITDKSLVFIISKNYTKDLSTAMEITARSGKVVMLTDEENIDGENIKHIILPKGEISYYVSVIIFQYIALGLSRLRKIDTDNPRNLAKSITVA